MLKGNNSKIQTSMIIEDSDLQFLKMAIGRIRGVSGQAAQPVPLAQLKLSMVVYGQNWMGDLPDERPKQLTLPSFGRDVKLGVPCLDAACIVGLN